MQYLQKICLLVFCLVVLISGFSGCSTIQSSPNGVRAPAWAPSGFSITTSSTFFLPMQADSRAAGEDEEDASDEEDETSVVGTILLYIPNRIFDLFDIARAGVNVGPGFGLDARVTKWARLELISDTSVGVGLQTLRHLPVCMRSQTQLGIGFISTPSMDLLNWHKSDYDLRLELYVLLVGAHVAVEMGEVFDFIGGIFTWDPMNDDFYADL